MAEVPIAIRLRRTYSATDRVIRNVARDSDAAAERFAKGTEATAKRRVHVITGRLRNSIEAHKTGARSWEVRVGAYYGVYEEMGTRYRPPHPYFRPAVEENKARFFEDMRKVFHT